MPSWRSVADPLQQYFGGPLEFPSSARKLDSSFSWLPWVGARAALDLLLAQDAAAVEQQALGLANSLRTEAASAGRDPLAVERPSQIVVIPVDDPQAVERRLAASNVAATMLGSAVRFGFHGFNDASDVDVALRVLAMSPS
jgi:hypothetical protein